ncbi:hypothetical protein VFPPC_16206 [Pochonia chlamydosporia 170]|uniref:Uncharacterized protein n=1 Tax=Pochonia chlamydosporia 170 TaxID=1380566 RepID=A0A179FHA4_METCM|nr:hypothetical protein VFPPC_16206 [Pochonia chlamydosporia 170]OAQ64383.1 hypothetical protein VFPPC_16206 [Pochonia chlamydosporia 170]
MPKLLQDQPFWNKKAPITNPLGMLGRRGRCLCGGSCLPFRGSGSLGNRWPSAIRSAPPLKTLPLTHWRRGQLVPESWDSV